MTAFDVEAAAKTVTDSTSASALLTAGLTAAAAMQKTTTRLHANNPFFISHLEIDAFHTVLLYGPARSHASNSGLRINPLLLVRKWAIGKMTFIIVIRRANHSDVVYPCQQECYKLHGCNLISCTKEVMA